MIIYCIFLGVRILAERLVQQWLNVVTEHEKARRLIKLTTQQEIENNSNNNNSGNDNNNILPDTVNHQGENTQEPVAGNSNMATVVKFNSIPAAATGAAASCSNILKSEDITTTPIMEKPVSIKVVGNMMSSDGQRDPLGDVADSSQPKNIVYPLSTVQKKATQSGLVYKIIMKNGQQMLAKVVKPGGPPDTILYNSNTEKKSIQENNTVDHSVNSEADQQQTGEVMPLDSMDNVRSVTNVLNGSLNNHDAQYDVKLENDVDVGGEGAVVAEQNFSDDKNVEDDGKSNLDINDDNVAINGDAFSSSSRKSTDDDQKDLAEATNKEKTKSKSGTCSSHRSSSTRRSSPSRGSTSLPSSSSSSSSSSKNKSLSSSGSHRVSSSDKTRNDKEHSSLTKDKQRSSSSLSSKHRSSKSSSSSSSSSSLSSSKHKQHEKEKSKVRSKDKERKQRENHSTSSSSDLVIGKNEEKNRTESTICTTLSKEVNVSQKRSSSKDDKREQPSDLIESKASTSIIIPSKKASISIEVRKDSTKTKTVKTYKSQFRSHGLTEEAPPPPSRKTLKKPASTSVTGVALPSSLPSSLKRTSPIPRDTTANEKKNKVELNAASVNIEKPGAIKLIPPKRSKYRFSGQELIVFFF